MTPFMTEDIYQNLVRSLDKNAPESIHLCDFPTVQTDWIDKELETEMDTVLQVVVLGRAARNSANIKNRQPIGTMFIKSETKVTEMFKQIIEEELNVKEVKFTDDVREFTTYTFKPQMKTLGPKYGKLLNQIRTILSEIDGNDAMDTLNTKGTLNFEIDGTAVELTKDDVLTEMTQKEGYASASDRGITVVLDTNLTEELVEEGYVREIISKIQTMRKEAGFEVMDHIKVSVDNNDKLMELIEKNKEFIQKEVLADEISSRNLSGFTKEWDINGENVVLSVEKITN